MKEWYKINKEKQKAVMHEWYIKNKQRRYDLNRSWRENNLKYNRELKRKDRLAQFYRKGELHLIENYDKAKADNFHGWALHHRLELTLDGHLANSMKKLQRLNMYYHRPYFELIFLPIPEHIRLHRSAK